LVILGPAIALMLAAGMTLYFLVLKTISNYADENIRASLGTLLQSALTIADSEVDRQNRERRVADANGALVYQLNARIRFEDFARDQRVGLIVSSDDALDFVTGVPQENANLILASTTGPGAKQIRSEKGASYYVASANFTPWNWKIALVKDAADFNALVRQVQWIYGGSALALLATAGLLVFGLRHLMVRPINQIAQEFSGGHAPTYRGVKELEHLSDSIGAMLQSLGAKTLHLETTLKSMSDAITVYDADLRLVAWNPQYLKVGRYPETLLRPGMHFSDLMRYNIDRGDYGPGDPEKQLDEIMARARTLSPPRFEIDRADGTSMEVRRAPMPDGGFVTTYRDITDRRQSARFEAANLAKSRFLENMSHDLRKPIAAVIEDCQLLLMDGERGIKGSDQTVVENIRENAGHLLGIIDELLEMSRIEAGQVEVKAASFYILTAVSQAFRVMEPAAKAKGLVLKTDVENGLEASTDSRILVRVLMNLVGNAVEYTSKGSVLVSSQRSGTGIEISVSDTGSGIPADKLGVIFEKFQRLEPTAGLAKPGIGLGLGLAISREFANLLGGDIKVVSEVGKGSTFTLTIPANYSGSRQ
jgi:signal transduction histidine kinase